VGEMDELICRAKNRGKNVEDYYKNLERRKVYNSKEHWGVHVINVESGWRTLNIYK
jgi:hypothetical protein